jgi:hypothetical protein
MPQVEVLTEASERTDAEAAPVRSVRRASGEIKKVSHGYSTKQATRPRPR